MFQKALEMTDKSESIYWTNVWWILAGDNLTFEKVMGDFRKNILYTDLEGEKLARIYLGKIISCTEKISLMTYIMLKKNLTPLYVRGRISNSRSLEKKFLPKLNHPYPLPTKVIWATT